jgi:hypothetical protein
MDFVKMEKQLQTRHPGRELLNFHSRSGFLDRRTATSIADKTHVRDNYS